MSHGARSGRNTQPASIRAVRWFMRMINQQTFANTPTRASATIALRCSLSSVQKRR